MALENTWRWFGPNDPIKLEEIRQTGATGIVTALHQIAVGTTWTKEDILHRKTIIENAGLKWSVVESVPVHEDIKKHTGNYVQYIENYKSTLVNLGECGINTVCYNFMPVLDWSRTELGIYFEDGSLASGFKYHEFAAFDLFILKRPGSEKDYPESVVEKAKVFFNSLTIENKEKLKNTILLGLPGSLEAFTLQELQHNINQYKNIDREKLKENLQFFLKEIVPVAIESKVRLAIHPDDPPWPLFGLPRIVSNSDDIFDIINIVDSPNNGITLCSGSLGAGFFNNVAEMAEKFAHRINFAHPRNVIRDSEYNFHEDYLFQGDVDIYRLMKALVMEEERRKKEGRSDWQIPMRPDHGNKILDDSLRNTYPGYTLYGRLKNLAELRGLEVGIRSSLFLDTN